MVKTKARLMLRWLLLSLVITLSALTGAIRGQQYWFRYRAERLLEQVRSLRIGKSNSDSIRSLMKGLSGALYGFTCAGSNCEGVIRLGEFAINHQRLFRAHAWLSSAYRILGGRSGVVSVRIPLEKDVVSGMSFVITTSASQYSGSDDYSLIGEAETVTNLGDSSHYKIGWPSACMFCVKVYVRFTPNATPADFQRLMQFDMTCLTRWLSPCRTRADIMPAALAEVESRK
jgi:hypothetical protein